MVASSTRPPVESFRRMRTPFVLGSSGGEKGNGTASRPRNLARSSLAGVASPVSVTFAFVTATPFVHGSHASPIPSPAAFGCSVLLAAGQLSLASHTPSPNPHQRDADRDGLGAA